MLEKRKLGFICILRPIINLFDVACAHQPLQTVAWNSQNVVQIGNARNGQTLRTPEEHFGRKSTDRSRHQGNNNGADVFENRITG
jgi:hypothetical protein